MIHLHNHTEFSLLDGGSRVKDLVQAAKSFNMPAVAITDHGNLHGAMDFYKACNAAEIKPIIGCEFYYAPKGRFDKSETTRHHLILLAKNLTGYHNLVKLSSLSYSEGFYYKPRIDWELLTQYNEGLIAMSACIAGEIPRLIQNNHIDQAILRACEFKELFEDYYLELMDHELPEEKVTNKGLLEISRKHNIPLVATNDTHYITRAASLTQDVLLCIGAKRVLSDPARFKFPNDQFWFKSPEEMNQIFRETPAAIKNTFEIAEKCNLEIKTGEILLPKFPVEDSVHHLRMLVYKNLPSRLPHRPPEVIERLNYELSIITNMGFSDYFLIVHDIISWAKSQKIPVGPGRGSAAGSLVAYVLGITELNPLDYGLLFERKKDALIKTGELLETPKAA